jgi:steroid 5-alpha reductase family enzyme
MGESMLVAAAAIAVLMVTTWLVSVVRRDASIVDIVWGFGFVAVSWVLVASLEADRPRQFLLAALTSIWGLRLAGYLARRNLGKGEDFRYQAMRRRWGARFPVISLVTVFGLQGAIMWIVSLPLQYGSADADPGIGPVAVMGIMVWLVGFLFETVGDAQLARFKADPANAGKVMDRGLWSLTRHPNYFGDSMVWWGIGIVAAETGSGVIGLAGPLVMMFFLMRVSGVPMLERSLMKRREGYAEYAARTSAFFPRPPRAG